MKKKYQYFVSSTYTDLKKERLEVINSILNLDGIPVGMEFFPASGITQVELIMRLLDECDYYVLVLAGRYGSTDENGLGYTEMEYDYALKKGIPIISFLHSDPETLPRNLTENDPSKYKKLKSFREKAKNTNCQFWENTSDLSTKITASLAQAIILTPRPGWIRVNEKIQNSLFPNFEKSGSETLIVHLKGLDINVSIHIQFFKEDPNSDEFDSLVKSKSFKLEQDNNVFTINKKDLVEFKGKVFKLFCKTEKANKNRVFQLLCENSHTVCGPGHKDGKNPNIWIVWFLTQQEPVNFASGSVGTINQVLTSRAYPRVKNKTHS